MLHNRDYMQDGFDGHRSGGSAWSGGAWPVSLKLIVANVVVYLVQIASYKLHGGGIIDYLALSGQALASGRIWTLLSYGFLHGSALHLIINMALLFFFSRPVESRLGGREFFAAFMLAVFSGGAFFSLFNFSSGGTVVGASAGVAAVLTLFCLQNAHQPMTFLLFFIVPIRTKPLYILFAVIAFEVLGLFGEVGAGKGVGGIAHSAHLGGIFAAWLWHIRLGALWRGWAAGGAKTIIEEPGWRKRPRPTGKTRVSIQSRREAQQEIDRILDKINNSGFGALTSEERAILDRAKDYLNRH